MKKIKNILILTTAIVGTIALSSCDKNPIADYSTFTYYTNDSTGGEFPSIIIGSKTTNSGIKYDISSSSIKFECPVGYVAPRSVPNNTLITYSSSSISFLDYQSSSQIPDIKVIDMSINLDDGIVTTYDDLPSKNTDTIRYFIQRYPNNNNGLDFGFACVKTQDVNDFVKQ